MYMGNKAVTILVTGLVQGVGFRPFVYHLARVHALSGWVRNTNEGVSILAQGDVCRVEEFVSSLRSMAPAASDIWEITSSPEEISPLQGFEIRQSEDNSESVTEISPDIAVCGECLRDLSLQQNRLLYPFVNCTHCGPRFSIIRDLPYDRPKTSMEVFRMCPDCRREYEDPGDRRFHAQPVACLNCGPQYTLITGRKRLSGDMSSILPALSGLLAGGRIVAIKGIGGFHLACDAFSEPVIQKLRKRKRREGKPFAVMFRDLDTLKKYTVVNPAEERALLSWRRPIAILEQKPPGAGEPLLPGSLSSGLGTIGAFLPYTPLHHMLFTEYPGKAIVLTSGNLSSEPIISDDKTAMAAFRGLADAFLIYNREIVNRSDDSIIRVINSRERIFRRSRGYVPSPVRLKADADGILAFGAELSAGFCLGKGRLAVMSQYIGDLKTWPTFMFYEETLAEFLKLFRADPVLLACDMHPDYYSGRVAERFTRLPVIRIQHHHAHIASVMAEQGLDERVIGVAFDGTGYGTDGKTWGAEFLTCDLEDFSRELHFEYVPLPGGDKAIDEPWRVAVAYLHKAFGRQAPDLRIPFTSGACKDRITGVISMIENHLNCPEASSAGRLFDAVSALLGLCSVQSFQAEAPMRLESIAARGCDETYPFMISEGMIVTDDTIRGIVEDILKQTDPAIISAKFHNTVISIIFESVNRIRRKEGLETVILSGGVFQNKYILEMTEQVLAGAGLRVFSNEKVPVNDGGIALGQLVIASRRRQAGRTGSF
jgi:hydrogenase maturation protein HypF